MKHTRKVKNLYGDAKSHYSADKESPTAKRLGISKRSAVRSDVAAGGDLNPTTSGLYARTADCSSYTLMRLEGDVCWYMRQLSILTAP